MISTTVPKSFIDAVASEMASGINAAVEGWMLEIESVLEDPRLTTLERLQAVQEIVACYRVSSGALLPHACEA
jgi:hypothetical protein